MGWQDDVHGVLFKTNEAKLFYDGGHTWSMKLAQLGRQKGTVRIITFSLPKVDYITRIFSKRPYDIYIVCHSRFVKRAWVLKALFPDIKIAIKDKVHSKVMLISPNTVYVTSANFGHSNWHETGIGVRSKEAHDSYVDCSFLPLWNSADELYRVVDVNECKTTNTLTPHNNSNCPLIDTSPVCYTHDGGQCGGYDTKIVFNNSIVKVGCVMPD